MIGPVQELSRKMLISLMVNANCVGYRGYQHPCVARY